MLARSASSCVVALLFLAGCQTNVTPKGAAPAPGGHDGGALLPTGDGAVTAVDQRKDNPVDSGASAPVPQVCGDGVPGADEACDDGNTQGGDGCAADCTAIEEGFACPEPGKPCVPSQVCGDKKISGTENCDDGNSLDGDGCSAQCRTEKGWSCPNPGARCVATKCGDGIVAGGETCDDGNSRDGDGCSALCAVEVAGPTERDGWLCATPGKPCVRTLCGNGKVEGSEQCDDGNNDSGDGCTPACRKEPSCPGAGGACKSICGDGMILPSDTDQECDDGNSVDGDGCSSDCKIEPGYTCASQAVAPKGKMILPVVYRDFKGGSDATSGEHPDFEHDDGRYEVGIVMSQLGSDGKPVHVAKDMVTTTNNDSADTPDWFSIWFKDAAGDWPQKGSPRYNYTFVDTLALNETGSNTGVFRYTSNKFFPIDDKRPSFGMTSGTSHNYHFTSEVRYWFQYSGNELLTFSGDDDVWVFVNKKLAVDLGGIHTSVQGSVKLDANDGTGSVCQDEAPGCANPTVVDLGLEKGKVYEIVVFQAERHTIESNYILTLSSFSSPRSVCSPVCGDGIVTPNEACDLGQDHNTGEYGTCTEKCTLPAYCGDGKVDEANGEECDDGLNLSAYGYNGKAACGPGCKWTHRCGDGKVDSLFGEQCDDGNRVGGDGCEANCTHLASCGNGIVDPGEECDDGNTLSNDGCSEFCTKQTIVY